MDEPDKDRVQRRANALLPEERDSGSVDPDAQAEEILAESDARTEDRVMPPGPPVEHRRSEDTVEPIEWSCAGRLAQRIREYAIPLFDLQAVAAIGVPELEPASPPWRTAALCGSTQPGALTVLCLTSQAARVDVVQRQGTWGVEIEDAVASAVTFMILAYGSPTVPSAGTIDAPRPVAVRRAVAASLGTSWRRYILGDTRGDWYAATADTARSGDSYSCGVRARRLRFSE